MCGLWRGLTRRGGRALGPRQVSPLPHQQPPTPNMYPSQDHVKCLPSPANKTPLTPNMYPPQIIFLLYMLWGEKGSGAGEESVVVAGTLTTVVRIMRCFPYLYYC